MYSGVGVTAPGACRRSVWNSLIHLAFDIAVMVILNSPWRDIPSLNGCQAQAGYPLLLQPMSSIGLSMKLLSMFEAKAKMHRPRGGVSAMRGVRHIKSVPRSAKAFVD